MTADGAPSPPPSCPVSVSEPFNLITAVDAAPGRLTNAYEVQKPVGKGGYAIVHRGIRRSDGRVVAVKKVEIFEMTQKKRDRCLQEVTLLAQLSHPNIIQMLDAFIDENMLIIIFEWAPAGDLKRLLKKTSEANKTLDEPTIWSYFSQIVDGLRYMHSQRIMHRDIKPANVLVGANGALKLGDLGLGRQLSEQTMEAFSKVGTPYYVSPEVVRGAGYDWKSDVWSLGCLLYELACLHSPFEMEGANLYDVFQRISKGDYEALPDHMFSPTLKRLVECMLSVDPAGRPELEEVWRTCQGSLHAQSKARVDVHTASERVYEQLRALETLTHDTQSSRVPAARDAKGPGRGSCGGRRSSAARSDAAAAAAAAADLPAPPTAALRLIHPGYFAESVATLAGAGGVAGLRVLGAEEAQKHQLGVFLQVFAWLLRIGGWQNLAAPVESHIELRTPPSRAAGRSGSRGRAATDAAGEPDSGRAPAPPPQRQGVPICTNVLQGAEAARRAALTAGISTEFAPVTAVAAGHGRAVCSLLQDLLDAVSTKLPLTLPKPRHIANAQGNTGGDKDGSDIQRDLGIDLHGSDDESAMLTAASPLPLAMRGGVGEEEEDVYALWGDGGHGQQGAGTAAQPSQAAAGASQPADAPRGAAAALARSDSRGRGGEIAAPDHDRIPRPPLPHTTQVDPVAWRLEAERLAPQLSRIKVSASAVAAGGLGEWATRWDRTKAALQAFKNDAPPAMHALERVAGEVGRDMERIETSERRVNGGEGVRERLEGFREQRRRLGELRQDVLRQQDLQQTGHAALAQLSDKLADVQTQIEQRASGMDGSLAVRQMRDAVSAMHQEIRQLEVRMGVVQQSLLGRARTNKQAMLEHRHIEGDDADWPKG